MRGIAVREPDGNKMLWVADASQSRGGHVSPASDEAKLRFYDACYSINPLKQVQGVAGNPLQRVFPVSDADFNRWQRIHFGLVAWLCNQPLGGDGGTEGGEACFARLKVYFPGAR
jgi:hypothetical protein